MFSSALQPMWGPTFSPTHCPVFGSDIICNNPLEDIVRFNLLRIVISLMILNTHTHIYIRYEKEE